MSLSGAFEETGLWLFKYRGQLPIILFFLVIPVIYTTDYENIPLYMSDFLTALAIITSLLGILIRMYTIGTTTKGTSGRNTGEQVAETLNLTGIYSIVRHPLYLGNYLIWIGITLYVKNAYFFIIISLMYWLYYERIMYAEEGFLRKKFNHTFEEWSKRVPAFFPSLKNYVPSPVPFSVKSILRREYTGVLATITGYSYVNFLLNWFKKNSLTLDKEWVYSLIIGTLLVVILKAIKLSTTWLYEEGRT